MATFRSLILKKNKMKIRADLHQHLLIGFHDFWIENQIGDLEKNLLEILIKKCSKKKINICAITSQYEKDRTGGKVIEQIEKKDFGLIHDRFGYLMEEAKRIQNDYGIDVDSENILLKITNKKTNEKLGIFNSQSVGTDLHERRVDTIVIGKNRIPNNMSLENTLKYTKEIGCISIAEHAAAPELYSIGDSLRDYAKEYDAFEWNAQMIVPKWAGKIPIIGEKVKSASKENNSEIIKYAKKYKKPVVAVSDAHFPEEIGRAYIEFEDSDFFDYSSKNALSKLKRIIQNEQFNNHFENASFLNLLKWRLIYSKGVKIYLSDNKSERGLGNKNLYSKKFLS